MLDSQIVKKIEEFVYAKPRSIQEIAEHVGKNWRTADRYIESIVKDYGTLSIRVFRGGTRGALKIVFWASIEKASHNIFQEQLEKEIFIGKRKEEFTAFDIFQLIEDKNKKVRIKIGETESEGELDSLKEILESAEKQLLIFSGNLSFINFKNKKIDIFEILKNIIKKGVNVKIISRVDLPGMENIIKMLDLNNIKGKELVEIRHKEQPLRCIIVDNKLFNIKEIKSPTGRSGELNRKIFLFYNIKDKEWTEWITKIFWKIFSSSINANKRIEELNKLKIRF